MVNSRHSLQEIRETGAPLEIAAIYHDYRVSSGNPQVNLIFRHLATFPRVLERTWDMLRPVYRSNIMRGPSERVIDAISEGGSSFVGDEMPTIDAETIRNLLMAYNRGNLQNLIALKSLLLATQLREKHGLIQYSEEAAEKQIAAPVPPLPLLRDLQDAQLEIVRRMAACHGGAGAGLVPSMYLHLTLWPAVLLKAADRISTLMTGPHKIKRMAIIDKMTSMEAAKLAPKLTSSYPRPSDEVEKVALSAIDMFVKIAIPEMILVGCELLGEKR